MERGFRFEVDTRGMREVHGLEIEALGRGESLAECLGDALARWARNRPDLAERFTLATPIRVAGDLSAEAQGERLRRLDEVTQETRVKMPER